GASRTALRPRKSSKATVGSKAREVGRKGIKVAWVSAAKASEDVGIVSESRGAQSPLPGDDRRNGGSVDCGETRSGIRRANADAIVIAGVGHFVLTADGVYREVILRVHHHHVQADAVGGVNPLQVRIEPTDVEGVEGTARLAGGIVFRDRDDVENAVSTVHCSAASGAIGLRTAAVQQKPEGHHSHHFKNHFRDSGTHGTTSSRNSPRIFFVRALL